MLKISPFALSMFNQCPRQYKFRYIDGLARQYRKPWPWLTMGDNIHAALKDFLSAPVEHRTQETIETLLRKKWQRNRQGFADEEEEKRWGERALAQVRWFAQTQEVGLTPFLLEKWHEAPIREGHITLGGRIDRIDRLADGSVHVIDYKTGRMPENIDTFQLLLYVLILLKTLPYPILKASYLYLASGKWHTIEPNKYDLQQAMERFLEMVYEIETEREYPERVSSLCTFCDFLEICGMGQEAGLTAPDREPVDF